MLISKSTLNSSQNLSQIEKTCTRELVKVRLLQILDINFIDNIVVSPNNKSHTGSLLSENYSNLQNDSTHECHAHENHTLDADHSNTTHHYNTRNNKSNDSILTSIANKFTGNSQNKEENYFCYENLPWENDLVKQFEVLVQQSTFDCHDAVVNLGLTHINNFLIGRNRGLFNGLTDFYRQSSSHQQGLNLYKLIQQYYKHCCMSYKASLINSKWNEVLQAIGRLIEQIKRLEVSEQSCTGKSNMSLNLSVCSFNSSGTDNSLLVQGEGIC